jgi:hypothetical protein
MKNIHITVLFIVFLLSMNSTHAQRVWNTIEKPSIAHNSIVNQCISNSSVFVISISDSAIPSFNFYNGKWKNITPSMVKAIHPFCDIEYDYKGRILVATGIQGMGILIYDINNSWIELKAGGTLDSIRAFTSLTTNPKTGDIWATSKVDGDKEAAQTEVYCFKNGVAEQIFLSEFGLNKVTAQYIDFNEDASKVYVLFNNSSTGIIVFDPVKKLPVKQIKIPYSAQFNTTTCYGSNLYRSKIKVLASGNVLHTYNEIVPDNSDSIVNRGGLMIINTSNDSIIRLLDNTENIVAKPTYNSSILYSHKDTLIRYDYGTNSYQSIDLDNEIPNLTSITAIDEVNDRLWIGTKSSGIFYTGIPLSITQPHNEDLEKDIWPNPINSSMPISMYYAGYTQDVIEIFSIHGNSIIVPCTHSSDGIVTIQTQQLVPGAYGIKLSDNTFKTFIVAD